MILSQKDAAHFFNLMWGLQYYVNQQLQLLPDVPSFQAFNNQKTADKGDEPCRTVTKKNITHIVQRNKRSKGITIYDYSALKNISRPH